MSRGQVREGAVVTGVGVEGGIHYTPSVNVSFSGICQYDTLPAIAQHIRVDVARGSEAKFPMEN
jgi:hypothetical protein